MRTTGITKDMKYKEVIVKIDKVDTSADAVSKTMDVFVRPPMEELICAYIQVLENWDTAGTCTAQLGRLNDDDAFITEASVKTQGLLKTKGTDFDSFVIVPDQQTITLKMTSQNNLNTATKGVLEVHLITRKVI